MINYEDRARSFDQSVLTALLQTVTPSPAQAALDLLNAFPSFQHATRANKSELVNIVGNEGADLLLTIPQAVTSMTRENLIRASNYIFTLNAAKQHFAAILNGRRNETFVVLYLNLKNRLVDEDIWTGGIDRMSVYPREILRRALMVDASSVLIAHNHPTGDTTPSDEDIRLTHRLETALDMIDMIIFDHLIFGEGEPYSLRENGVL